jgi:hypothetical protein
MNRLILCDSLIYESIPVHVVYASELCIRARQLRERNNRGRFIAEKVISNSDRSARFPFIAT